MVGGRGKGEAQAPPLNTPLVEMVCVTLYSVEIEGVID